ncbi:MAG: formate dehydrogenase accessory protein FdhE [Desulfobacterales bacterium]|nr:MAG: formate dehydrogenase accessory protein FdhE [Desulfobacterales bacterium]
MNKDDERFQAVLDKMNERIDAISEERPSHKEALGFVRDVLTEKLKAKPRIQVDTIHMDEELLKVKKKEGFSLVNKQDLKLDISSASALFKRLCERMKQRERISEDVDRITKAIEADELDLKELFQKAAAEDREYMADVSGRLKLQEGLLFFLAENSLQPIFETYAEKLKDYVDMEHWWRSYCPICGSKPVMAELIGRERKKFLICSCCGYEWRFMRTKCPFCENDERRKFKYFFTEKEGRAYRVETCQKCKKYIKTVDTEETDEEVIPAVEDIGTLYLDAIAREEGYTREVYALGLNLADI